MALQLTRDDLGKIDDGLCNPVYGVVYDMPIDGAFATLVVLCDGNMSLYTTGSFGIIGGIGHAAIRKHSQSIVALANKHMYTATGSSKQDYPTPPNHRIFLLTTKGKRSMDLQPDTLRPGTAKAELFEALQRALAVLSQLDRAGPD